MKKRRLLFVFLLLHVSLPLIISCKKTQDHPRQGTEPAMLQIAAAANLSYVIPKLVEAFREKYEEYENTDIRITKASSGSLVAQIRNGAPFGLFLSANTTYPQALYGDSLTVAPPEIYAEGIPVMVFHRGIEGERGVGCLTDASVEKVAIARPELAPYGEAALQILQGAGVLEQVQDKFVYGVSVTQTFQHATAAADAGFIAASLLHGGAGTELEKAGMQWIGFPDGSYDAAVLQQAMVLLDSSNTAAADFYTFMLGEEAAEIMEKNGYRVR